MMVSIIIPTLNEEAFIPKLLEHLFGILNGKDFEIIVVDGGSTDLTLEKAQSYPCRILSTPLPGRAVQMNAGAREAQGKIFYFVHADVLPPSSFMDDILDHYSKGCRAGMFRQKFNGGPWLLLINSFLTRFDFEWTRGGDQTLFVDRDLFFFLGGFDERYVVMEEYEFMRRLRSKTRLCILKKYVLVSSRKYEKNSYFRVAYAYFRAHKMFRKGRPPEEIKETYQSLLNF
jgi:rSAM/selenodomain-associated transferase 2